ncbi:macrophage mannose receptor 1-like isoform X2 [Sparus aurata]|uniref:macrophage mannose receptor 1-like isoform X2 n=1 Tax=Sparus aurata TaxID=8175 RepID=UPI0011C102C7|nr:macrophage mannose receptor 1-like isoform X2 [Sparus aurata]
MDETVFVLLVLTGFCIPSASSLNVYYFVDKNMTWSDAQDYCIDHHTNLAEILNKENLTTMMNTAAGGYKYKAWIGLSRMMFFRWVDGKKITFTNWETGEPHIVNTMEVCVVMTKDGYWRDNRCALLRHPLCIRGGRYLFGSTTLTWADALTHCEDQQATLATFPGDHVTPVWTVDGEMVWIGLSGLRRWYWSETGNYPTFMNWTTYEFSDQTGEENCAAVELQNGTWTDEQCNATYPFFCYGINKSKKTVVRMKIRSKANVEDPAIIADLQQQLHIEFAKQGLYEMKLTWTKLPVKWTND